MNKKISLPNPRTSDVWFLKNYSQRYFVAKKGVGKAKNANLSRLLKNRIFFERDKKLWQK